VFLFDVDNTLLDNDQVIADLSAHLEREVGVERERAYWEIFEALRTELGYADYLGALQRYRTTYPHDPCTVAASRFLLNYPLPRACFRGARRSRAVQALGSRRDSYRWRRGLPTPQDRPFGPRCVRRRVLIYVHKETELADVEARYPADHYVMVDDKLRILDAMKRIWGSRVTTVFVRQGHYAHDPAILENYPPADLAVERVGELLRYHRATLRLRGERRLRDEERTSTWNSVWSGWVAWETTWCAG
jgi:hypothetical protein